jgi:cytochrome oxidase Cu insertion factor (SCO1/SenC/PrrC family)
MKGDADSAGRGWQGRGQGADQCDTAMGYPVDHWSYTYVLGPNGKLARTLDHATPSGQTLAAIRAALGKSPPGSEG